MHQPPPQAAKKRKGEESSATAAGKKKKKKSERLSPKKSTSQLESEKLKQSTLVVEKDGKVKTAMSKVPQLKK